VEAADPGADLVDRVQRQLDRFLARQAPVLDAASPELKPLLDTLDALLSSGKRLRPAFCSWGWRAAGAPDDEAVLQVASALELVQACALVHDDVMDDSDTRRGRPSVHRAFAELHRDAGWLGSAELFGTGAAILLGDLCLAWADEMIFSADLPAEALLRAKPVYDLMRTELMAGQYLDVTEQARGGGSVERSLVVVRTKTAKYTVERPLHLGALLAGGDASLLATCTAYGMPLGEAFQLRDDLLGVFGDPAETGKPAGDDLREGKRTVLVALAAERATPAQEDLLKRLLGDRSLSADGVDELRETIVSTGAVERVETMIRERTQAALDALGDIPQPARGALEGLALAATSRTG
jgi:geranylgeranyl diphosphate synthase type I